MHRQVKSAATARPKVYLLIHNELLNELLIAPFLWGARTVCDIGSCDKDGALKCSSPQLKVT